MIRVQYIIIAIQNSFDLYKSSCMSFASSPKQSSSSQGSASQEYIKIVEQLIDSDDDETIMKKMALLQSTFPLLKKMANNPTNQDKINMFLRDHIFKTKLTEKLRESNRLCFDPIIKVELYTIRHRIQFQQQLSQHDVESVFQKFGTLQTLVFDKTLAYLRYDSYVSCYTAIKTLNQFQVSDTLRLSVGWIDANDISVIHQYYAARCIDDSQNIKKRMARYDIYLEINSDFQLSKRIIGPQGINMKKIISEALEKSKVGQNGIESKEAIAKLRLRGKGSGFLEGWNHAESDQLLNLCVSSKNPEVYSHICDQCQKLLFRIGWDYKQYYFKLHKKQVEGIIYRKFELKKNGYEPTKQLNLEQVNTTLDFIGSAAIGHRKIKQKQIIRLIALRDKARKKGEFAQADEIREHLRKEGVMIVDSKHASGKELKTTWKYL